LSIDGRDAYDVGMSNYMIHDDDLTMDFAPRLWDATPGVCCAAFQLGACAHTEAFDPYDYDDDADEAAAEAAAIEATDITDGAPRTAECEWVEYHPDMDGTTGEFGCPRFARHVVTLASDWDGTVTMALCDKHKAMVEVDA
jgi:hypothetical protein